MKSARTETRCIGAPFCMAWPTRRTTRGELVRDPCALKSAGDVTEARPSPLLLSLAQRRRLLSCGPRGDDFLCILSEGLSLPAAVLPVEQL